MFTVAWWYLFFTLIAIVGGLFISPLGFYAAMVLCLAQVAHFGLEDKNFFSFTCQIRYALIVILGLGLIEPLGWIYWIPVAGLSARLALNYCLLARLMSLLPWNRKQPLSWALVQKTIFSPPTRGSVLTAAQNDTHA